MNNKQNMNPKDHRSPIITIENMHKWYGDFHVLRDINLTVKKGERIVICGPSGSGKSTLIRCINRLEEHQRGHIVVDGIELNKDLKNIEKNDIFDMENRPKLQDESKNIIANYD